MTYFLYFFEEASDAGLAKGKCIVKLGERLHQLGRAGAIFFDGLPSQEKGGTTRGEPA